MLPHRGSWHLRLASDAGWCICGTDFSGLIEAEIKFSDVQSFRCILYLKKKKKALQACPLRGRRSFFTLTLGWWEEGQD